MKKLNKLSRSDAKARLTGLSTSLLGFGFGAQWEYSPSEQKILQIFVDFLEDRRALYNPMQLEVELDVASSVNLIRECITKTISSLPNDCKSIPHLRAIRAACRKYADTSRQSYPLIMPRPTSGFEVAWLIALGELRATVGIHLAILIKAYNLNIEDDLAVILPEVDD